MCHHGKAPLSCDFRGGILSTKSFRRSGTLSICSATNWKKPANQFKASLIPIAEKWLCIFGLRWGRIPFLNRYNDFVPRCVRTDMGGNLKAHRVSLGGVPLFNGRGVFQTLIGTLTFLGSSQNLFVSYADCRLSIANHSMLYFPIQ